MIFFIVMRIILFFFHSKSRALQFMNAYAMRSVDSTPKARLIKIFDCLLFGCLTLKLKYTSHFQYSMESYVQWGRFTPLKSIPINRKKKMTQEVMQKETGNNSCWSAGCNLSSFLNFCEWLRTEKWSVTQKNTWLIQSISTRGEIHPAVFFSYSTYTSYCFCLRRLSPTGTSQWGKMQ